MGTPQNLVLTPSASIRINTVNTQACARHIPADGKNICKHLMTYEITSRNVSEKKLEYWHSQKMLFKVGMIVMLVHKLIFYGSETKCSQVLVLTWYSFRKIDVDMCT